MINIIVKGNSLYYLLNLAMYPLSKDVNLDDLLNDHISQIRIGKYDVQFCFGKGRIIQSQGKIESLY